MERRRVICFFTLKRLRARTMHTELESVFGPEWLALLTLKKWWKHLLQERTDLFEDSRFGMPLVNDLA
jgi:hypothetical protein